MRIVRVELLRGIVEAEFLGFMCGRGLYGDASYDGELVALRVKGEELLQTAHFSRVLDEDIQAQGRAFLAAHTGDEG